MPRKVIAVSSSAPRRHRPCGPDREGPGEAAIEAHLPFIGKRQALRQSGLQKYSTSPTLSSQDPHCILLAEPVPVPTTERRENSPEAPHGHGRPLY